MRCRLICRIPVKPGLYSNFENESLLYNGAPTNEILPEIIPGKKEKRLQERYRADCF